jgi:hypothetical protein
MNPCPASLQLIYPLQLPAVPSCVLPASNVASAGAVASTRDKQVHTLVSVQVVLIAVCALLFVSLRASAMQRSCWLHIVKQGPVHALLPGMLCNRR